jgi:hypothetical protein
MVLGGAEGTRIFEPTTTDIYSHVMPALAREAGRAHERDAVKLKLAR